MRRGLTLIALLIAITSFGQERTKYNGLNKKIPHKNSFGFKGQANYYMATYTGVLGDASSSTATGKDLVGGGGGAYYRKDFNDHVALQFELLVHHRQGYVLGTRSYDVDSAFTVHKEEISGYNETWMEIPIYFKYRWEVIFLRKGHWKTNVALSTYIGPRAVISPYSRRDLSRATYTELYEQTSYDVQNHIDPSRDATPRFSPIAGMGIAAGFDLEFRNGLILHTAFYRGLLTQSLKSHGYKMYDNRIELGLGIRVF